MLVRRTLVLTALVGAATAALGQETLPAPPVEGPGGAPAHTHSDVWLPQTQTQIIAPYAGHVNHAHAAPTFRWGWFGAEHYYPRVHWHENYVGDRLRWSTQRRY